MHDFVADEATGDGAIFAECDGEGAEGVECGAGFDGLGASV
ncbi:MAG: hypothetical protein RIS92_533 [Verrucomicrobiota bacterium]